MSTTIQQWETTGEYIKVGPFQHRVFVKQVGKKNASPEQTLLLLHGFPESSFSYHAIIEGVKQQFEQVILFDMIGYGWSDKPAKNFSYSLIEQADIALMVWKYFNIKGGHLLAHDMGDSVATELVSRQVNDNLPAWFNTGFQSFTFTNGSMILDMASLRITQKILLSRFGHLMKHLLSFKIFNHQIVSAHGNDKLSDADIQNLWESNRLQDGHLKTHLTIKYLNDRKKFEKTRWLPALRQTQTPVHICWGNQDAVARVEIAHYLKKHICPSASLTIMEGAGHFCQLGSPELWVKSVCKFYHTLLSD
ncbi:alpha/beta fold hydrolase [Flavobacteriaceae bacterium R38]|nr:alpha/beta fold hydrolase [Flavobacteriaceae bacterium R38]